MIEELKILQEIFGDLTGFGVYAIAAYIAYKLVIFGSLCFLAKIAMDKLSGWFTADITRAEANIIKADVEKTEGALSKAKADHGIEMDMAKADHDIEIESMKHMYKILKESKVASKPKEEKK